MTNEHIHPPMNMLLAYDGSEHSRAALSLLNDLCSDEVSRSKSNVTLLTVITPRQTADHDYLRESIDSAETYLNKLCYQVESELILGYPAEKIVEFAEAGNPDLIIVGAKGLRATLRILLGGVAQQIVEYASCPVLVVRAPYKRIRRILIVTDGSKLSGHAFNYLSDFPLPPGADVIVMHVLSPSPIKPMVGSIGDTWPLGPDMMPHTWSETTAEQTQWQEEEEQQGKKLLEDALDTLNTKGIKAISILKRGDAATEILEYIDSEDIDLVVAGSRGLGQVQGWLLGSVSRKLVHYANCSLLIVKNGSED
jgi:nucleotide-binding universal stress UspA family protein